MRRETVYKLAGRRHDHPYDLPEDIIKKRLIYFASYPPGQLQQAFAALSRLEGLSVEVGPPAQQALCVSYSLLNYTQETLENALIGAGFHLDSALLPKLRRAIASYCEQTQLRNLLAPQRLIKQSAEVFIQAYAHETHGDHDETPDELRIFR